MDRLEAAIERVVKRMIAAWDNQQEHEAEVNKPALDMVKAEFDVLLQSETFDDDLMAFEGRHPGAFARLTTARLRSRKGMS